MRKYLFLISCMAVSLLSSTAHANIVLGGTRLIYPAGEREVTIAVANKGVTPSLVQSWMDDGKTDSTPENSTAPFVIMPPITRIEGQASQTLRILFNGTALPEDKEYLFWLNVLEIPPVAPDAKDKNNLLLAIQSRIKVFYRPRQVTASLHDAAKALKWHLLKEAGQWRLICENDSALHVSFADIQVVQAGKVLGNTDGTHMVAPGGRETFDLSPHPKASAAGREGNVQFEYINDYGALKTLNAEVQ